MAQYLPFWPKAAAMAYCAPGSHDIFSKALPTNGFTEVVLQLQVDEPVCGDANTTITVVPQISNDGVNWEDQAAFSTSMVPTTPATFPVKEVEKHTDIAAFMRVYIHIVQATSSVNAGGTFLISGAGRS